MFSLSRLGEIVIYALAVGICIRVFATGWRRLWNIDTGRTEGAALAGAVMGFLVVWGIGRGPGAAGLSAGVIITGYFVAKLIKKGRMGEQTSSGEAVHRK